MVQAQILRLQLEWVECPIPRTAAVAAAAQPSLGALGEQMVAMEEPMVAAAAAERAVRRAIQDSAATEALAAAAAALPERELCRVWIL